MSDSDFPMPSEGFLLTHMIIASDVKRSYAWYEKILDGKVVLEPTAEGTPCILKAANSWIVINFGGGDPTRDKPQTTVTVKQDQDILSTFLNIRVADAQAFYDERKRRGAEFITKSQDRDAEIRCYTRDPDGYLIEVGQSTM